MIYRFSSFEMDVETFELRKNGMPLSVQRKLFDVLRYLIEHRDRVVWKDELLEAVWAKEFVVDSAVHRVVSQLRSVLGQDGRSAPIETVYGRGYRFRAEVDVHDVRAVALAEPAPIGPAPSALGVAGDPFVGRTGVVDALLRDILAAPESGGAIYLLTGEPGIGKTRCVEVVTREAQRYGTQVWKARCSELEGTPPFWPWVQILRACSADLGSFDPRAAAGRELIEKLTPERAVDDKLSAFAGKQAAAAKFRLFDELCTFLVSACSKPQGSAPTYVLWLDDLSRSDSDSFRILDLLSSSLHQIPLVVLITLRSGADVSLRSVVEALPDQVRPIPIEELSQEDVTRYVSLVAGIPESAALAARIYRKTGGNPLFVREMLRYLLATYGREQLSGERVDQVTLPAAVHELIDRRLHVLGEPLRRALEMASVLGETFELSTLARVAELPASELQPIIDRAIAAGLLRRGGDGFTYGFMHGLIRDALYDSLSSSAAAALHLRVAEALEEHAVDSSELAELAYHFYRALPLGEPRKVVRYATQAVRSMVSSGGYTEAGRLFTWSLAAQRLETPVNPRRRCKLLANAALCQSAAGNAAAGRAHVEELVDVASRNGFCDVLGVAGLILRPMSVIAVSEPDPLARQALEAATLGPRAVIGTLRARVLSALSGIPPYSHDRDKRLELSAMARELAHPSDSRSMLDALAARYIALSAPEDLAEARKLVPEFNELIRADPTSVSALQAHFYLLQLFLRSGDVDAAGRELRELGDLAREWRMPEPIWIHDRLTLQDSFYEANLERATQGLRELYRRSQKYGIRFGDRYAKVCASQLRRELGVDLDPPILEPDKVATLPWGMLLWQARAVREAAEEGRHGEARTELARLARSGLREVPRDGAYLATLAELSLAICALGAKEHAPVVLELLRPYAEHNVMDEFFLSLGSVAHYLGILSRLLGDHAAAVEDLEAALAMNQRLRHRPQIVRTRLALASCWIADERRSEQRRGVELLHATHAEACALGLTASARAAEAMALRAGRPIASSFTER